MKVGKDGGQLVAYDERSSAWVRIGTPWNDDLLRFLGAGASAVAAAENIIASSDRVVGGEPTGLPFAAGSLRAFALWEKHMVGGAHGMIDAFAPPALRQLVHYYEAATKKVFPPLQVPKNFHRYPQYYMSNHRSLLPDGAVVPWPSFSDVLDFELELGIIIGREVRDCTPAEGRAAIAGFTVINDLSLRDVQWSDTRAGTFGGVVKAKTWAGAMGAVVVTADGIIDRWTELTGRVLVNGDIWVEGSTARPSFGLGEAVAYAARGETVYPGDVLSTGTLPGCCGLELRRFAGPGDEIRLEIDGIGQLTTTFGPRSPSTKKAS